MRRIRSSWQGGVAALAVAGTIFAGCGGSSSSATSSKAFAGHAEQVVSDIAAGNDQAVWGMFDATMKAGLRPALMQLDWQEFQNKYGTYKGFGTPAFTRLGTLYVENVPVVMANGTEDVEVTFESNGMIAGLYLRVPIGTT